MKLYLELAEHHGNTLEDLKRGHWGTYVDVKCRECGKEHSMASVGGIGGKCLKCGGECL